MADGLNLGNGVDDVAHLIFQGGAVFDRLAPVSREGRDDLGPGGGLGGDGLHLFDNATGGSADAIGHRMPLYRRWEAIPRLETGVESLFPDAAVAFGEEDGTSGDIARSHGLTGKGQKIDHPLLGVGNTQPPQLLIVAVSQGGNTSKGG